MIGDDGYLGRSLKCQEAVRVIHLLSLSMGIMTATVRYASAAYWFFKINCSLSVYELEDTMMKHTDRRVLYPVACAKCMLAQATTLFNDHKLDHYAAKC